MCRSKSKGGRRCTGGKCAESRRARQRAYQARKRAAAKAFTQTFVEAQQDAEIQEFINKVSGMGDRSSWGGVFADLRPLMTADDIDTSAADRRPFSSESYRREILIDALKDDGRFDLLDKPLSDEDRAEIASLSVNEMSGRLTALRDHFNVDAVVSESDKHSNARIAEGVVRYMGDVTGAWVDAQLAEELESANEFSEKFDTEYASITSRTEEYLAMLKTATETNDRDLRHEAFVKKADLNDEMRTLTDAYTNFAKRVGEARASVLTGLLAQTVGTSDSIPVTEIAGQKKLFKEYLAEADTYFPDSWKQSTKNSRPLSIRYSQARAHYSGAAAVKKVAQVRYETREAENADHTVPTPVDLSSRRRYGKVSTLVGGDPDNPQHVALMETECRRLEADDAEWISQQNPRYLHKTRKSKPQWEVYTNVYGRLAVREVLPSSSPRTVGVEAVIRVDKRKSTMIHEMAHRMEDGNPHLATLCKEFVRRRSTNDEGVRDKPIRYYGDKEPVYEDHFAHAYVGKVYPDKHTEVLSTGMEALLFGKFGAGLGLGTSAQQHEREHPDHPGRIAEDKEHINFVMGLLMSAAAKKKED